MPEVGNEVERRRTYRQPTDTHTYALTSRLVRPTIQSSRSMSFNVRGFWREDVAHTFTIPAEEEERESEKRPENYTIRLSRMDGVDNGIINALPLTS